MQIKIRDYLAIKPLRDLIDRPKPKGLAYLSLSLPTPQRYSYQIHVQVVSGQTLEPQAIGGADTQTGLLPVGQEHVSV